MELSGDKQLCRKHAKNCKSLRMARFHFTSRNDHSDTLFITLRSVEQKYYSDLAEPDANMDNQKSTGDSVVPLQLDSCGNGTISVPAGRVQMK